jgi:hypothetical protein
MGFYFKVAPGVKIRASSRGVRASLGPRVARVHVGTGGLGVSTGTGPVSLYQSVGVGRSRPRGTRTRTSIAAQQRALRQAQQLGQAKELIAAFNAITNLHRGEFPTTIAPVAAQPTLVDEPAIFRRHQKEALRGLSIFQASARASARQEAREAATREISTENERLKQEWAYQQRQLDEQWHRLLANDTNVVFATLTELSRTTRHLPQSSVYMMARCRL